MANLIQIKRSATATIPVSLANGELAYTSNGDVLYIGSPNGQIVAIGGFRNPGVLTANQALVANTTSGIDKVIVANLVPQIIYSANNGTGTAGQVLTSAGSGNVFWSSPSAGVAGANTQIQFNDSGSLAGDADFTFNKDTNTLTVGTATINSTNFSGTANNALYLGGTAASGYQTTAGLAANVATLTANNATNLAGAPATAYVNTSGSYTLSGNIAFTGANTTISNLTADGSTTTISSNVNITGANVDMASAYVRVGDMVISGNLFVNGTTTSVNTQSLEVRDSLIKLADNNLTSDTIDIGFYGVSGNSTVTRYSGLIRDSSSSSLINPVFRLFSTNTAPTSIVDETDPTFVVGTLEAFVNTGAFFANATYVSFAANSTTSVTLSANSLTLTTPLAGTSGGTGKSTVTNNAILVGNSTNGYNELVLGTAGYVLQSNGTALVYDILDGGTF